MVHFIYLCTRSSMKMNLMNIKKRSVLSRTPDRGFQRIQRIQRSQREWAAEHRWILSGRWFRWNPVRHKGLHLPISVTLSVTSHKYPGGHRIPAGPPQGLPAAELCADVDDRADLALLDDATAPKCREERKCAVTMSWENEESSGSSPNANVMMRFSGGMSAEMPRSMNTVMDPEGCTCLTARYDPTRKECRSRDVDEEDDARRSSNGVPVLL